MRATSAILRTHWRLDAWEKIAQPEVPEDVVVHAGGIMAETEEDEDHKPGCNGGPAVEEHLVPNWDFDDLEPILAVDFAPGIPVPGQCKCDIVIEDECLQWENADQH